MEIELAHDRAELIRIAHRRLRSVPIRDLKPIIQVARRVRHARLKKSVPMNLLCFDWLSTIRDDVDLARIRTKRADGEIVAHSMRTQNPKRIAVRAGEKAIQLVRWNSGNGKRFH